MKTAPSHLRSHVQNAITGYTSFVYQAKIVMGVPSDHAYGDKHGPISSWLKRFLFYFFNIFKKIIVYSHCCIVGSASRLTKEE